MKKNKYLVSGILFFFTASTLIFTFSPSFQFFPDRETNLSHNADFGNMLPGNIFIQEITMKKNWLEQIEIYFGRINSEGINESVVLLVDESGKMLFSRRFSSREIEKADYYPFKFRKPLEIGKGKKVFIGLASIDGNPSNCLAIPLIKTSPLGPFSVAPLVNNDFVTSISNPTNITKLEGSIGVKTFETDHPVFSLSRIILLILTFLITLKIIFLSSVKRGLAAFRLRPEFTFASIAAVFGGIFLCITPPFQAPDEPTHFYRAYELTEFNFFRNPDEVPASIRTIAAAGERMKFKSWEKTSKEEILSLQKISLEPQNRTAVEAVNYTIPYFPQSLGISVAKIFSHSPLWFLYAGRLFNLVAAIVLIFLAIRISPIYKWLFVLLGVMPMTLSQIASISYDATTIGLSFLLFAFILRFAFSEKRNLEQKEIILLFVLTLLLAFCKPPYFFIGFTFLIIPVSRVGSMKRFVTLFAALLISAMVVSQFWPSVAETIKSVMVSNASAANTISISSGLQPEKEADVPKGTSENNQGTVTGQADRQVAAPAPVNPFNAEAQKKFILEDPVRFSGILVNTFVKYTGLYITSFVGLFGWNDTALPDPVVYLFLTLLLVVAIITGNPLIAVPWRKKLIVLTIFIICVFIIELGLYLYTNIVGSSLIVGVQGRYFIPLAPLVLLLLYRQRPWAEIFRSKTGIPVKQAKGKVKATVAVKRSTGTYNTELFNAHYLPWILITVSLLSLGYSILIILNRFYIITC